MNLSMVREILRVNTGPLKLSTSKSFPQVPSTVLRVANASRVKASFLEDSTAENMWNLTRCSLAKRNEVGR